MKKFIISLILAATIFSMPVYSENSEKDMEINSLYAANKLEEAFNLLVSIPQEERTAQQLLLMGNIMLDHGRNEDAEFMFNSALSVDPKFYKAHYNLGNIHLANNQPFLAIENYKLALKYNKEFAPAYYNMGCAYLKVDQPRKAKNAFHDAIFFKPNIPEYYYNLAYAYKLLGKEKDAKTFLGYYNKLINNY